MDFTTSNSEPLLERTLSISNHEADSVKHLLLVRFRIWRHLIATMDGYGSKASIPAYKVDRVSIGSSLQRHSQSRRAVRSLLRSTNLASQSLVTAWVRDHIDCSSSSIEAECCVSTFAIAPTML